MLTTNTDTETGWTKEFPHVEGFYFARRTQTNAPGLTVIQVWQYEDEWFAYRFANSDDIEAKDFVRSLYEYLGPVSPSDFEQLTRLRELLRQCLPYVLGAAEAAKMLDGFHPQEHNEHRLAAAILDAIGDDGIRDALRAALAQPKGE